MSAADLPRAEPVGWSADKIRQSAALIVQAYISDFEIYKLGSFEV